MRENNSIYILGAQLSATHYLPKAAVNQKIPDLFVPANQPIETVVINYLGRRYAKKLDRSVQLAIFTAETLISQFNFSEDDRQNTGLCFGNNYGGWNYVEGQMQGLYQGGENPLNPYVATAWFPAAAQGEISIRNKLHGHSKTFSLDQLSSAVAIEYSIDLLRNEKLKYVITGGYESLQSDLIASFLYSNQLVSDNYQASEAASMLMLSQHDADQALAEIAFHRIGNDLTELLSELVSSYSADSINYYMLAPLNISSHGSILAREMMVLNRFNTINTPIGMPTYFLGDICGASFAAQVNMASWMIQSNSLPYSYLGKYGIANTESEHHDRFTAIVLIGRDYFGEQYSVSLIRAVI